MAERTATINNQLGIHARPAALLVQAAAQLKAEIHLSKGEVAGVNGKSIMGIMMLAAGPGAKLTVHTDSPQADDLFEELRQLFAGKFQDG